MCNHVETASHSSFIKPFIALIAVGALFYELLNNLAAHMYILGRRSSQLSSRQLRGGGTKRMTSAGQSAPFYVGSRVSHTEGCCVIRSLRSSTGRVP